MRVDEPLRLLVPLGDCQLSQALGVHRLREHVRRDHEPRRNGEAGRGHRSEARALAAGDGDVAARLVREPDEATHRG